MILIKINEQMVNARVKPVTVPVHGNTYKWTYCSSRHHLSELYWHLVVGWSYSAWLLKKNAWLESLNKWTEHPFICSSFVCVFSRSGFWRIWRLSQEHWAWKGNTSWRDAKSSSYRRKVNNLKGRKNEIKVSSLKNVLKHSLNPLPNNRPF